MLRNNFESKREVKWCPGCGNYSILAAMQKALHEMNWKNENTVFISGIGCSGRFPYYINTYGFHTLHGRAPSIATGLKITRPDLNIWIVVGDGDAFSIGLNHLIHMVRRNLNVNILFINNKIYALTKGQYSPTSSEGSVSKSSPKGSLEEEIKPISTMINQKCSFVARVIDSDIKKLKDIIKKASNHEGTSFIEVLQNCNVFNDKIFDEIKLKDTKLDRTIELNNNKPLIFGKNYDKYLGIKNYNKFNLEIIDKQDIKKYFIPIFDSKNDNIYQNLLAEINQFSIPFPLGIFREVKRPTYESKIEK